MWVGPETVVVMCARFSVCRHESISSSLIGVAPPRPKGVRPWRQRDMQKKASTKNVRPTIPRTTERTIIKVRWFISEGGVETLDDIGSGVERLEYPAVPVVMEALVVVILETAWDVDSVTECAERDVVDDETSCELAAVPVADPGGTIDRVTVAETELEVVIGGKMPDSVEDGPASSVGTPNAEDKRLPRSPCAETAPSRHAANAVLILLILTVQVV